MSENGTPNTGSSITGGLLDFRRHRLSFVRVGLVSPSTSACYEMAWEEQGILKTLAPPENDKSLRLSYCAFAG